MSDLPDRERMRANLDERDNWGSMVHSVDYLPVLGAYARGDLKTRAEMDEEAYASVLARMLRFYESEGFYPVGDPWRVGDTIRRLALDALDAAFGGDR